MPPKGESAYSEEEITEALLALIAWAGNGAAAVRMLKQQGKRTPGGPRLLEWSRTVHLQRYDELRGKYQSQLEANLANEMRDVARLAVEVERLAIEKARLRLKSGDDQDPGRTAANLARVAQSSTDKVMTLTSRPVTITENRDPSQILAGLIAKHPQIFGLTEEPKQIEVGAAEEGSGDGA